MAPERPRRRQRLSPAERRAQLLATGADLALRRPGGEPLDDVTLSEVADAAGVTDATVHHHFGTKSAFSEALLEHLLDEHPFAATQEAREQVEAAMAEGADLVTVVRLLAEAVFPSPPQVEVGLRFLMSMWARNDEAMDQRLAERYRRLDEDRRDLLVTVLTAYGLEPRPPFDWDLLVATVNSLHLGLAVRHSIDAEAAPADAGDDAVNTFAVDLLALLRGALREIGGEGDVWDVVDRVPRMGSGSQPVLPLARTQAEREHVGRLWAERADATTQ